MTEFPNHTSPPYSAAARDDALFHYTNADGLIGILRTGQLWNTAYYCTNDETELTAGNGFLTPAFMRTTNKLIKDKAPLIQTFWRRGVDPMDYAKQFESMIRGMALSQLCAYITCFFKPVGEEDFVHGLLSQWRAYGSDGGYAIQFSRKKLAEAVESSNGSQELNYQLRDVHYSPENALKTEVMKHTDAYIGAFMHYLEELGSPDILNKRTMPNPIATLLGGPLEDLLDYLIHTKNVHFAEERECRLSLVEPVSSLFERLPTEYFGRSGLIVPYKQTPRAGFPLLDCIEWIVIGPTPRLKARFTSIGQIARAANSNIKVRPSHIPLFRG